MFNKVKLPPINENLKGLLVKTAHQKVLSFFLANPTDWFYGSEISRKTGISAARTSMILRDLSKIELLEKETKGKTELYRILVDNPALKTYKVLNTLLSIAPLVSELKNISGRIILYGSCAKGENIEDSDLDLFVVSTKREEALDIVGAFSKRAYYGFSEIRAVIKRPPEWAVLENSDPVFFNELQKGISLYEKEIDESKL